MPKQQHDSWLGYMGGLQQKQFSEEELHIEDLDQVLNMKRLVYQYLITAFPRFTCWIIQQENTQWFPIQCRPCWDIRPKNF